MLAGDVLLTEAFEAIANAPACPLPFLPTYGRHFRLLNRSVKALAQQYGADYVSIPYTSIANDGHPTVCGHKYIARQILKAVRK